MARCPASAPKTGGPGSDSAGLVVVCVRVFISYPNDAANTFIRRRPKHGCASSQPTDEPAQRPSGVVSGCVIEAIRRPRAGAISITRRRCGVSFGSHRPRDAATQRPNAAGAATASAIIRHPHDAVSDTTRLRRGASSATHQPKDEATRRPSGGVPCTVRATTRHPPEATSALTVASSEAIQATTRRCGVVLRCPPTAGLGHGFGTRRGGGVLGQGHHEAAMVSGHTATRHSGGGCPCRCEATNGAGLAISCSGGRAGEHRCGTITEVPRASFTSTARAGGIHQRVVILVHEERYAMAPAASCDRTAEEVFDSTQAARSASGTLPDWVGCGAN